MPKSTTQGYIPRHTEDVVRETVIDLFCQAQDAIRTRTAKGWETAARAFDQAADACRVAERVAARPCPAVPPPASGPDVDRLRAAGRAYAETADQVAPGLHHLRAIVVLTREGGER